MYLLKFLTLALASGSCLAWPHPPRPHKHPNCTVGVDTKACTLPDGGEGMFLCHPRPFRDGDHHEDEDGLLESIVGGFHHMMGHLKHGSHHHHGHERHLRSGNHHHHGKGHHHGGGHDDHGKGHHHDHHSGKKGCPHGPPGLLSQTHCVPLDGPHKDDHPFPGWNPGHGFLFKKPTCGCCGDVCPVKIDSLKCGCSCDLPSDLDGDIMANGGKGAGVWVTVTLRRFKSVTIKKCVPAGAYADADRVQCVADCSAPADDSLVEEEKAMKLLKEGGEDLEEKESRD